MAIALGNVVPNIHTGNQAAQTFTWTHVVEVTNPILLLAVTYEEFSFRTGAVTYGGVAMTLIAHTNQGNASGSGGCVTELYYLKAPATGSNTVSITTNATVNSPKFASISFTGVDQTTPLDTSSLVANGNSASPVTINNSLTTAGAGELIVTAFGWGFPQPTSITPGQTQLFNDITGSMGAAGSYQVAAAAGSHSDNYSVAYTQAQLSTCWVSIMAAFKAANTTATQTITGKGLMAADTTQTQLSKADVTNATAKTTTGKASIPAHGTQTQLGKTRLTNTSSAAQQGQSRISIITPQAQPGKSRMTASAARIQTGMARIGSPAGQLTKKTYLYKIYDPTGITLLTTWSDEVSTDPGWEQNINTAGSQVVLTLSRDPTDFGEGDDVDYNNRVVIICVDAEAINGVIVLIGKLVDYAPVYENNNVAVTIFGYGVELDNYMYEDTQIISTVESIQLVQEAHASWVTADGTITLNGVAAGNAILLAIVFHVGGAIPTGSGISSITDDKGNTWAQDHISDWNYIAPNGGYQIAYRWATNVAAGNTAITIEWYDGGTSGHSTVVSGTVYAMEYSGVLQADGAAVSDNAANADSGVGGYENSWPNPIVNPWPTSAITTSQPGDLLLAVAASIYGSPAPVAPFASLDSDATTVASNLASRIVGAAGSFTASFNGFDSPFSNGDNSIVMVALRANIVTVSVAVVDFAFTAADPGAMFRAILDNYIAQGGTLGYDTSTVQLTGASVDYTFRNMSIMEALEACRSLAPAGWYWYVDQATNMVHFHAKATTPQLILTVGKDIEAFTPERRVEAVVNRIFLTGGQVNGGSNFYRKYEDTASIATYGPWLKRYADPNIVEDTAGTAVGLAILGENQDPEVRATTDVIDSNGNTGGKDIETITVGMMVGFRNSGDARIDALLIQLTRLGYTPDTASLTMSSVPPDVTKREDQIARLLQAYADANNPGYAT